MRVPQEKLEGSHPINVSPYCHLLHHLEGNLGDHPVEPGYSKPGYSLIGSLIWYQVLVPPKSHSCGIVWAITKRILVTSPAIR